MQTSPGPASQTPRTPPFLARPHPVRNWSSAVAVDWGCGPCRLVPVRVGGEEGREGGEEGVRESGREGREEGGEEREEGEEGRRKIILCGWGKRWSPYVISTPRRNPLCVHNACANLYTHQQRLVMYISRHNNDFSKEGKKHEYTNTFETHTVCLYTFIKQEKQSYHAHKKRYVNQKHKQLSTTRKEMQ